MNYRKTRKELAAWRERSRGNAAPSPAPAAREHAPTTDGPRYTSDTIAPTESADAYAARAAVVDVIPWDACICEGARHPSCWATDHVGGTR